MTGSLNLGDFLDRTGDPDRPLFIEPAAGPTPRITTLAEFDARCNAAARGLLARGIARGERIAILSANRVDYVAAFMGAMRAGIVPAPVNQKLPRATATQVVADSGARLVLFDAARETELDRAALPGVAFAGFDDKGPDGFEALLDPGPFTPVTPDETEAGFMMFTSGSTGRPKGVLLSHGSHRWTAEVRMRQTPMKGERVLIAAPLYHMNALALSLLVCAGGGGMRAAAAIRGGRLHRRDRPVPRDMADGRAADDRDDAAGKGRRWPKGDLSSVRHGADGVRPGERRARGSDQRFGPMRASSTPTARPRAGRLSSARIPTGCPAHGVCRLPPTPRSQVRLRAPRRRSAVCWS
jgi:hypothetical protein